jgi:CBS domain-containing protein
VYPDRAGDSEEFPVALHAPIYPPRPHFLTLSPASDLHSGHASPFFPFVSEILACVRSLIVICLPDRLTDFGRLVGILTERDLLATVAGRVQTSEARVREWMTENPVTVPEATPIGRAASIMVTHNFRHLPIVDGERTIGIVSLRDVVRSVVRAYPEYEDEGE